MMINYGRFIGKVASRRQPSIIRELLKILQSASPDMIPLSGGLPNPAMFPFKSAAVTLRDGTTLDISGQAINSALQYLPTNGHAGLLSKLRDLQVRVHGLEHRDFDTCYDLVTCNGSQDGLSKTLEMMINPGEPIIVDDHTFFATMGVLDPHCASYIPVETDPEGMRPDRLWQAISSRLRPRDPTAPKVLYSNPTGSNPCGSVLPAARKQEIYDICCEYDIIIIEDDPYFYMQFGPREPSFLSMDRDRRVIRLDSFSKVLSSGLRLGFITAPHPLMEKIVLHLQTSALHASALSQVSDVTVVSKGVVKEKFPESPRSSWTSSSVSGVTRASTATCTPSSPSTSADEISCTQQLSDTSKDSASGHFPGEECSSGFES